jgi:hypothetical protein
VDLVRARSFFGEPGTIRPSPEMLDQRPGRRVLDAACTFAEDQRLAFCSDPYGGAILRLPLRD